MNTSFSPTNFDLVYHYIETQIQKSNLSFYKYSIYELYLEDGKTISLKRNGYTISQVYRGEGVLALAKRAQDQEKIIEITNQIFNEILILAC